MSSGNNTRDRAESHHAKFPTISFSAAHARAPPACLLVGTGLFIDEASGSDEPAGRSHSRERPGLYGRRLATDGFRLRREERPNHVRRIRS